MNLSSAQPAHARGPLVLARMDVLRDVDAVRRMLCVIAPVYAWEIAPGVLVSNASVIWDNGGIKFRIMNVNRLKLRFTKCMNYWHSSSISRIAYGRTSNSGRTHVFPEMISDMT